jgi:superfamily I DNA/RNA helicase
VCVLEMINMPPHYKTVKFFSQAKAAGRTAEEYEKMGNRIGGAVLRHYEATLLACNALDYHDFINFSVRLLKEHPEGILW